MEHLSTCHDATILIIPEVATRNVCSLCGRPCETYEPDKQ